MSPTPLKPAGLLPPSSHLPLTPRLHVEVQSQPAQPWGLSFSKFLKLSEPPFFCNEKLLRGLNKKMTTKGTCLANCKVCHTQLDSLKNGPKPILGLPWWCREESACQCRGHGFEPWSGTVPHATEQLSPCATTPEAHVPRARAPQQKKPAHGNEE